MNRCSYLLSVHNVLGIDGILNPNKQNPVQFKVVVVVVGLGVGHTCLFSIKPCTLLQVEMD